MRFPLGGGINGLAAEQVRPIWTRDYPADPRIPHEGNDDYAAERMGLKAMAAALGGKKAEMADPAAAQRRTGYVLGGISPLGQRQSSPTVVDESALALETILVSGGRRGLDIELDPAELIRLTAARTARIGTRRD